MAVSPVSRPAHCRQSGGNDFKLQAFRASALLQFYPAWPAPRVIVGLLDRPSCPTPPPLLQLNHRTWPLHNHLQVDGLVRLQPHHQLHGGEQHWHRGDVPPWRAHATAGA